MEAKIPDPAVPVTCPGRIPVDIHVEGGGMEPDFNACVRHVAETVALREVPEWILGGSGRPESFRLSAGEIQSWCSGHPTLEVDLDGPVDGVWIWPILTNEALAETSRMLRSSAATVPEDAEDAKFWKIEANLAKPELSGPGCMIFACGSSPGEPTGILVGSRWITVWVEEETVSVDYDLGLDYVYVLPGARKRLAGAALAAVASIAVSEDLDTLAEAFASHRLKAVLKPRVSGEAHSSGGEAIFETVHGAMEIWADMGCFPDGLEDGWMREPLEDWSPHESGGTPRAAAPRP